LTEPQKGPDGGEEKDGWLVLVNGTIKNLAGQFKVYKNCTMQHMKPPA
jgi:hypothetical protein